MPTLTMRNKLQETKCLRVCQKSNSIAKRSCSHLEIHQSAAENCTTNQSCKDVYPRCELNALDTGTVGTTNYEELVGGEDMQFKKLRTSSDDCSVIDHMELPVVSCSTNLEAIFSPILGQIHVGNPYTTTGVCIDQGSFNFSMADESDGNSGSSTYHQTCNFSDFYISDMVLASLQFDGVYVCDDIAETLVFPEFDTSESNIFDLMDQCMSLPFLGDLLESSESIDAQSSEEARLDCGNSGVLLAIHQICPGDQETECRPCFDSDEAQYFNPQSFIRNLPDLLDVPNEQPTFWPKESRERRTVTLVLDLDETLVHSSLEYCEDADFTFTVFFNMKEITVYVKERPHLRTFLKKAAELFEVIVFTASQSIYAEKLLDILDPDGQLISGRAYRESCIFVDGGYTKDLTVLGLDLAKVMIIDNSPQVFRFQNNNGIPIKSWFDDPSDYELISLIPFLETLADVVDVRPIIAERFGNKE